jgi:hypothetical protein
MARFGDTADTASLSSCVRPMGRAGWKEGRARPGTAGRGRQLRRPGCGLRSDHSIRMLTKGTVLGHKFVVGSSGR